MSNIDFYPHYLYSSANLAIFAKDYVRGRSHAYYNSLLMKNNKNQGYVYLLTNPAMPGIVKIGMTHRDQLDAR